MEMLQVPSDRGLHDMMTAIPGESHVPLASSKAIGFVGPSPRGSLKRLPGLRMVQLSRNLMVSTGRQQASSRSPNARSSITGQPRFGQHWKHHPGRGRLSGPDAPGIYALW